MTYPALDPMDPDAVVDYSIDWSDWLGDDTIDTSTWIVPSGITKNSDSKTTAVTTIWVSQPTAGESYTLTNRIVTAGGRTADRSFVVSVAQQ